jgi:two-component system phosphate regulon sensor histidine kinase PhoR
MPFQKNISSRQLAFFIGLAIASLISPLIYFIDSNWKIIFAFWFVIFLLSFCIVFYSYEIFTYRKIKLIYKLISQTKLSKKEDFYFKNILPNKSIEEARIDAENWAEQKRSQLETLIQNEIYRKEFLQNLSHELKTPIFSIQGYIDTLINGAMFNAEVNTKFLQNTALNIERLVKLVEDLDEISKLESGTLQLNFDYFIIQDVVKDVFEIMSFKLSEKSITGHIKKGCEQPLIVYADKEKIKQVFVNLIENAIKYGKTNGTIEASFYVMGSTNVLIEISDNGIGISEEHKHRIFERFYRTDHARSRKEGGSGLGLAICKHILEAHQQIIDVRSTVEVGSTFGFLLPMNK